MCGGGGSNDQTVTQKTELDPALRRLLYGGTIANPRGGFGGDSANAAANAFVDKATNIMTGGGGDGGPSGNGGFSGGGYSDNAGVSEGGDFGGSGGGFGDGMGIGGVYADGGMVAPQQGLAALNQGQMPMMGGQMPNLSDPMTAASLAMAVRYPEMQYGPIMAQPNPMMMQPQQRYAVGGYVEGPGTGRSDDIETQIYQNGVPVQEARLSDGEFVMTERAVRGAGDGDREEGAAKMYRMMQEFERGGYV